MIDLDDLERKARAAEEGWLEAAWDAFGPMPYSFAAHVAAMNPATTLALIAELRAAREVVEAAKHPCTCGGDPEYACGDEEHLPFCAVELAIRKLAEVVGE